MNYISPSDNVGTKRVPTSATSTSNSWGSVIGAGITALGSLIGANQQNQANASMNEETRIWQGRQNRLAEEFQEKMWNRQNEYNTPTKTRERLQAAGYNPWMSGSGSPASIGAAGSSGSGHSNGAPSPIPMQNVFGPTLQNGVNTYMGLQANKANIANQNAQTIKMASEAYTEYLKATGDYKGGHKLLKTLLAGVNRSDRDISDLTNSLNYGFIREKAAADYDSMKAMLITEYGKAEAQKKLDLLDKNIDYVQSMIDRLSKQNEVSDAEINKLAQEAANYLANATTTNEVREYVRRKYAAEAKILEADPMADGTFASMQKGMPVLAKFLGLLVKFIK